MQRSVRAVELHRGGGVQAHQVKQVLVIKAAPGLLIEMKLTRCVCRVALVQIEGFDGESVLSL